MRRRLFWATLSTWVGEFAFFGTIIVSIVVLHPTVLGPQVPAGWPNRCMVVTYGIWLMMVSWSAVGTTKSEDRENADPSVTGPIESGEANESGPFGSAPPCLTQSAIGTRCCPNSITARGATASMTAAMLGQRAKVSRARLPGRQQHAQRARAALADVGDVDERSPNLTIRG